jgi:hypothetical protein
MLELQSVVSRWLLAVSQLSIANVCHSGENV